MTTGGNTVSHAGGVVYRMKDGLVEYLLIRPKSGAGEWLLPKGHIETGEMEENAALREVKEETGVTAQIVCPLGVIEFTTRDKAVRSQFFLMKHLSEGSAGEQREHRWFPFVETMRAATHSQARHLLEEGEKARIRNRT